MKDKTLEVLQKLQERKKLRLKQLEEAEQQEKKLKKRLANLDFELAETDRLLAENKKLEVEIRHRELEQLRKKPGAKWKWKGELGYHLICAVKILTSDGSPNAQAFRGLYSLAQLWRSNRGNEKLARFEQLLGEHWQYLRDECCQSPRQLAARYCEALKAWGPYFERDAALDAEMQRLKAISTANKE